MPIFWINQKLVYFAHVPKCGGSAVEDYLMARFGQLGFLDRSHLSVPPDQRWNRSSPQHIHVEALARIFPPTLFSAQFAVVRHPFDRVASVFRFQRDIEGNIPKNMEFSDWLDRLGHVQAHKPFAFDNHYRPMAEIVPDQATIFQLEDGMAPVVAWLDDLAADSDFDLDIEPSHSYDEFLAKKKLEAGPPLTITDWDRRKILGFYHQDFARFGYGPDPQKRHRPYSPARLARAKANRLKILIFGATGQVATELERRMPADIKPVILGREQADLSDPAACAAQIDRHDVDAVINAAAYTDVDRAEEEEDMAHVVNAQAPAAMARAAARRGIPFLHLSTDYVFDGSGNLPWKPADSPAPLGAYGRSKLAGEDGVRAAGGPHVILRTSWVFSDHGKNFVRTMLRLGSTRDRLNVVGDQIGGPTAAADIADALLHLARAFQQGNGVSGTYHFAGAPDLSWAAFAREILAQAGLAVEVNDIGTADYPTPAARPANSRLDCSGLETNYGIKRPDWRKSLTDVLSRLGRMNAPDEIAAGDDRAQPEPQKT